MNRIQRRLGTWVALLAMTLNALWPAIAQAKPGPAPTLVEVCTSAGLQKIAVGADLPADHTSGTQVSPHCAFCSFGTDQQAVLPAAPAGILLVSAVRDSLPAYRATSLRDTAPRSPAQPRAPPYSS